MTSAEMLLPLRIAEMFDFSKPSAPISGTNGELLVKTCISLGDVDLQTSCTSLISASFLKHAACSGIVGSLYMIGVT